MKLKVRIKNKECEIDVLEKDGKLFIKVGDKEFVFGIGEEKKEEEIVLMDSKVECFLKEIKSSLSGSISEVFLKEGDVVKKNQKILTLSAMKMENEIVSESKGKIKKIMVKTGDKVKEGDILIILE
ncbi:MAG: acetyl-CoA carboxylase biotin carboxyl carrier protein subunit [Candidatus Paceibacterota bacterium]|jgi:biotin carboxyl carrier protein